MKEFIKKLFCGHPRLQCEEYNRYGLEPDSRIIYTSPWSLFGIREIEYKCNKCGKIFWYTKGDMAEQRYLESFIKNLTSPN